MRRLAAPALLAAGLLAGCTTLELQSRPPPGFDLSGRWMLLEASSETAPSRRVLRARGGMLAFVTQDFPVLRAEVMRIEQSRDSMGIDYDVGDYRDISWGTRRRGLWEVRAGWHEGNLIILSDASDAEAKETLTLSADGQRLTVHVEIDSGGDDLEVTRVYRRD